MIRNTMNNVNSNWNMNLNTTHEITSVSFYLPSVQESCQWQTYRS